MACVKSHFPTPRRQDEKVCGDDDDGFILGFELAAGGNNNYVFEKAEKVGKREGGREGVVNRGVTDRLQRTRRGKGA